MGEINVLDIRVANLIAAGEVVDRPASAVKELIENAIDAGADKITVEIKKGGISFIRVCDNGKGMSREDVPVCIKRHATSKIRDQWDLGKISTLGFRGEALAAISSVSKMRIMTKRSEDKTGTLMMCEPGEEVKLSETGCPDGTTVIIEELFANVPARRKFLKKDMTEGMAISNMVEKLALSRSDISFKFIYDDVVKFVTAGDGKLINVIYALYGREYAKKMTAVEWVNEGVKVYGYIGNPDNVKNSRNSQIFFVNSRYVRNKTMSAALEQAFDSFIPESKFPCCVLKIEVHPAFVDANVHPTKAEVKFSDEKQVFDAIYSTVRSALEKGGARPEFSVSPKKEDSKIINAFVPVEEKNERYVPEALSFLSAYTDENTYKNEKNLSDKNFNDFENYQKNNTYFSAENQNALSDTLNTVFDLKSEENSEYTSIFGNKYTDNDVYADITKEMESISQVSEIPERISLNNEKLFPDTQLGDYSGRIGSPHGKYSYNDYVEESDTQLPFYRIVGEAFYSYIFVELNDKILVIDKHAAHERIIFEGLKKNMKKSKNVLQFLVVPTTVELNSEEKATVEEYWDEISAIGFEIGKAENDSDILLFAVPMGLEMDNATDLFMSVVDRLTEGTGNALLSRDIAFEKALYQASCKAAIKAGRPDAPEDTQAFVEKLLLLPDIRYCPHGRPVAFELTKDSLEKQFKRK